MREGREVGKPRVFQVIGEKKNTGAELGGDDVLGRVVADHQAGLGPLV